MILLRELEEKDAPLMLEWMHDPDIQKGFKKNMLGMSMDECVEFCVNSKISSVIHDGDCLHFAIVDDEDDEYLGTVSLKDVDLTNNNAEFAITLRKKAQGKGIAHLATDMVLHKAFFEYGLHRVYLSVLANNAAAIRLYERCGFILEGEFRGHIFSDGQYANWKWYGILKEEFCARETSLQNNDSL